jgi:hypothetical protein
MLAVGSLASPLLAVDWADAPAVNETKIPNMPASKRELAQRCGVSTDVEQGILI